LVLDRRENKGLQSEKVVVAIKRATKNIMTSHQEIVANSNQGYGNNDDNDDDDISNTITINNSSIVYWIQFDAHTLSLETLFRKLNFIFPHVSDVGLHQNKFNSERNNSNGSGDENDVNDNNNSSSNNNDTLGVGHCKHRYRFNPIHTLYVSENPNCESQVIPLPEVGEGLCVEIQNKTQYQVASPSTRLLLTESNEERKNNFQTHSVVGQKGFYFLSDYYYCFHFRSFLLILFSLV
jgi:hypothetical protein